MTNGLASRFWSKVDKRGPNECWVWIGCTDWKGYGRIKVDGQARLASRIVWMLTHGETIASETCVCHSCDNPLCVNPDHLWLGSARDNHADKIMKGRHRFSFRRRTA